MDTLDPQDWPAGVVAGRVVLLRESGRPGMSELIDQVTPPDGATDSIRWRPGNSPLCWSDSLGSGSRRRL
jgi:hypothetical protein